MSQRLPNSTQLGELTWPQYHAIASENPVLVVPAGSIEQHGPHLPLTTDTVIARGLAERVARALHGYTVEALPYGMRSDPYSGGGEAHPGTLSLRPETMVALTVDVLGGLAEDGFRRLLLLSAHYENAPLLREAARRVIQAHRAVRVLFCNWWDLPPREQILTLFPAGFPGMELEHAGLLETSLMLYLAPSLVRSDVPLPDGEIVPLGYEMYPETGVPDPSSGALAPAIGATANIGEQIAEMVARAALAAARRGLGHG